MKTEYLHPEQKARKCALCFTESIPEISEKKILHRKWEAGKISHAGVHQEHSVCNHKTYSRTGKGLRTNADNR